MIRIRQFASAALLCATALSPAHAQQLKLTEEERTPMACDQTFTVEQISTTRVEKADKPVTILFSVPAYANLYTQALLFGARKAADEAGVTLQITAGTDFMDPASQMTQLENALSKKPDAVLINPADPDGLALFLDEVVEGGTPVIDVGSLSNSTLSYKLVQDDYTHGVIAAGAIMAGMPSGETGIVMGGPATASWARRRVAGFLDTIAAAYPVAATVSTNVDPQEGLTKFLNAAQASPELKWVYATGSFLLAPQSIPEEFAGVTYIAGSLSNVTEEALREGKMTAVIPDFPISAGYLGVKLALDVLDGKEIAKRNCLPVVAVSAADLADPMWKENNVLPADFKQIGN